MAFVESFGDSTYSKAYFLDSPPSLPSQSPSLKVEIKENYRCNIFLQDGQCLKSKTRKRRQMKRNRERLEELARPRQNLACAETIRTGGQPLNVLLPRILTLAEPKNVTPKYVKPKEEPIVLPGKIKDWDAHKQWLEKRAKPKEDCKIHVAAEVNKLSRKITRAGMARIEKLAKPRTPMKQWHDRPRIKKNRKSFSSSRNTKLSQPKLRAEIRALTYVPKVSKSAMNYRATERIESLATPRKGHRRVTQLHNNSLESLQYFCCGNACDYSLLRELSPIDRKLKTA